MTVVAWGTDPQEWQDAAEALAEDRSGRSAERYPHALGVDPDGMRQWAVEDALDTLRTVVGGDHEGAVMRLPVEVLAAALATHTQIGIELGLWLAQSGRVG